MIQFMENEQYNPETYILRNGSVSLYSKTEALKEDIDWFRSRGYKVYTIDCKEWNSLEDFHQSVSLNLEFPSYYGRNMDAFSDSICELKFGNHTGILIVLLHYNLFVEKFPKQSFYVVDDISSASRRYLIEGLKLIALIETEDYNLSIPLVGASPVCWNLREKFSSIKD